MFFFQMKDGLMKVVQCLNRSWTHDSLTDQRVNVWGKCPDTHGTKGQSVMMMVVRFI